MIDSKYFRVKIAKFRAGARRSVDAHQTESDYVEGRCLAGMGTRTAAI
jgi:hypothetical protein